jgi:glycosyltransferase involved in cell wall biosynthesis
MNKDLNPLISIIIPTYNVEKYIKETLNSVINQSYNNFEVLVIDDSSTDSTAEEIKRIAKSDGRISYYKIEHAGRPSVPRNYGISKSSGEYVAFLDADDIWNWDKLKDQIRFLQKYPNLIFVYSMSVTFGNVNVFSPYYEVLPLLNKAATTNGELILKGNSITCSSVMVRKEYLQKTGGYDEDPNLKAVEDYDLWLRLSELGAFGFIPKIHVNYRIHGKQSSSDWETKQKRLEYLSKKRGINLPKYKYYRNKGLIIRFVRNLLHFSTYLWIRFLSFIDSNKN